MSVHYINTTMAGKKPNRSVHVQVTLGWDRRLGYFHFSVMAPSRGPVMSNLEQPSPYSLGLDDIQRLLGDREIVLPAQMYEQVERGVDVVITNPELVKTGLDLLDFPTIGFLQTGYNVYTLQQAARRSWRIGQRHPVRVVFWGYQGTAQTECLRLMAKKIAVSQSTSGDMPESGLDVLNQDGDSIEVALARKLVESESLPEAM